MPTEYSPPTHRVRPTITIVVDGREESVMVAVRPTDREPSTRGHGRSAPGLALRDVVASDRFTGALDPRGQRHRWGSNWGGDLGGGRPIENSFEPVRVADPVGWPGEVTAPLHE